MRGLVAASLLTLVSLPAHADELAPKVEHRPLAAVKRGEVVEVRARITTVVGSPVAEANLFVQVEGLAGYTRLPMAPIPEIPGLFTARVPAALASSGFAYYLEAFDSDGNGPGRAGSPESPFVVTAYSGDLPRAAPPVARPAEPAAPVVVAAPAAPARRARSQLPTFAGFTLAGLGLGVGGLSTFGYQSYKSELQDAFGNGTDHGLATAANYRQGQFYGTLAVVGFGVAALAAAGSIAWLAWPDEALPAEKAFLGQRPGNAPSHSEEDDR